VRVLVKEVNWLGDVVISLPALRAVRDAYPDAGLSVLVRRELATFFDGFEWIGEILPYDLGRGVGGLRDRLAIVAALRARRFDLAVLFPKSFDAALWPALARVPRRAGWRTDGRRLLLTDGARLPPPGQRHQVHSYLEMLRRCLAIEGSPDRYEIAVAQRNREAMTVWLRQRRRRSGAPLIALAVAAAYGPAKEWPAPRYAELIDVLAQSVGAECLIVGAPGERARCEAIAAASRAGALVAAGDTHLGETIALLSLCDGFAGNDSGAMHLAGALGLPTVGLFGSTDPVRTGPLGPRVRVLQHRIECSPCFARTCRFGHYECLARIAPDEVVGALADLGAVS
jgi:heptosyltransferase-2